MKQVIKLITAIKHIHIYHAIIPLSILDIGVKI